MAGFSRMQVERGGASRTESCRNFAGDVTAFPDPGDNDPALSRGESVHCLVESIAKAGLLESTFQVFQATDFDLERFKGGDHVVGGYCIVDHRKEFLRNSGKRCRGRVS